MIVVRLEGGLGNQMFQYALGRQLALQHGTELKLDVRAYELDSHRQFLLDRFPIRAQRATWRDIWKICPQEVLARMMVRMRPSRLAHKVIARIGSPYLFVDYGPAASATQLQYEKVVRERQFHFDPAVLQAPDDVALVGYWQSERYFQASRAQILQELRVEPCMAGLSQLIAGCASVSLHIRRGDFVKSPYYTATSVAYCHKAMEFFRQRLKAPRFFVFTDDLAWVREQLPFAADVQLVSGTPELDEVEEFRLMSHCQHHILAASTFSWWAAWLDKRPGSLVVSPPANMWFRNPLCQTQDILPADWVTMPVD